MKEKLIAAISNIISVKEDQLKANPENYYIGNPVAWDSLSHLSIMFELENISGKEISVEDMENLDTLSKVIEFLEK